MFELRTTDSIFCKDQICCILLFISSLSVVFRFIEAVNRNLYDGNAGDSGINGIGGGGGG